MPQPIPLDNIRRQYASNAKSLASIAAKARAVAPKKYRGCTADYWEERAALYLRVSTGTDAELREHIAGCFARIEQAAADQRAAVANA